MQQKVILGTCYHTYRLYHFIVLFFLILTIQQSANAQTTADKLNDQLSENVDRLNKLYRDSIQYTNVGISIFSIESIIEMSRSHGGITSNGRYYTTKELENIIAKRDSIYNDLNHTRSEIKSLIDSGADINYIDKSGKSSLVKCIYKRNYPGIKFLFSIGASIKTANDYYDQLQTEKKIVKILKNHNASFTIRDGRYYRLPEPGNVDFGMTILSIGNLDFAESTIALRTGLNLGITIFYRTELFNEFLFVYKGEGNYDITDFVYSPTIKYFFAPGDFYLFGGLEYTNNLSNSIVSKYENDPVFESDFGVNKSTWSYCSGIGYQGNTVYVELRYKSDLSNYYSHLNKKQKTLYISLGVKF